MPTEVAADIKHLLSSSRDLPSMPGVAIEVLRITELDDGGLPELARAVSIDPALAVKFIKLANSPTYAMRSVVTSLERACMILGVKTVRLMSLGFSLVGVFPKGSHELDFNELWRRSITRAAAGRSLARLASSHLGEEAFLAGLVSHLGQMVLAMSEPALYKQIQADGRGEWPDEQSEVDRLGFSSRQILDALLCKWQMPELILFTVRQQGKDPSEVDSASDVERKLLRFTNAATKCEKILCDDSDPHETLSLRNELQAELDLNADALDRFAENLDAEVAESAELLNLEIEPVQAVQLLVDAHARLVVESINVARQVEKAHRRAEQLETRNIELASRAQSDSLTGIANRRFFDETLTRLAREYSRGNRGSIGLLMIDIDNFKKFNDTYGHQVGDEVLRVVGQAIRKVTRGSDLPARYGGEEFVVLMPGATRRGTESLAERLLEAIGETTVDFRGEALSVTASIGGGLLSNLSGDSATRDLVALADYNLYEAKRAGRNRVCFH